MTPTEVLAIAWDTLRAAGRAVEQLKFSHAVFLAAGNAPGFGNHETWLAYFVPITPADDGLADYDVATVAIDAKTNRSHLI